MTVNFVWTDERVEALVSLHKEGLSRGAIAKHFGVTRNAVIGKMNRLKQAEKLPDQTLRKTRKKKKRAAKPSNSSPATSQAGKRQEPSTQPEVPPNEGHAVTLPSTPDQAAAPAAPDLAVVEGTFLPLAERSAKQCCFPIWSHKAVPGDPLYGQVCGAPVRGPGEPYCAAHAKLTENPRRRRWEDKRISKAMTEGRKAGVL